MAAITKNNPCLETKYFRAIGLWQFAVEGKLTWWVLVNFFIGCIFLVNISIQLWVTLTSGYEFSLFTEKLSVNLTVMESVIKIIYYCTKKSKLHSLSSCFKEDLLMCSKHDKETTGEVLGSSYSLINNVTKSFVIMIFSVVGVWNALPILKCVVTGDCSRWNIMPSWYPETLMSAPALIYTYEFFIMVYCASLLYNVNCFFSALALSISAQFQLLSKCLGSIRANAIKTGNFKIKVMDRLIRECLIDHQRLLMLTKELEEMYNPMFLFQMFASTFTICLVLVQINVHLGSGELPIAMTMKFVMYLLFGSLELLVYSWGGQILFDETDALHWSFYESDWNESSPQFKKNIAIAMTRTMRPDYLTAGKFYRVDLASFTQIIKASYSYFTFLHGSDSSARN